MEHNKSKITFGAILKRGLRDTLVYGKDWKINLFTSSLSAIAPLLLSILTKKDGGAMKELFSIYQVVGILLSAIIISFILNTISAKNRIRRDRQLFAEKMAVFQKELHKFLKRGEDIKSEAMEKDEHRFVEEKNRWKEELKIFLKENCSIAPFSFGELVALEENHPAVRASTRVVIKSSIREKRYPAFWGDHVLLLEKLNIMYRKHFQDE